jgi:adenosylhomocysteine nucleosidase
MSDEAGPFCRWAAGRTGIRVLLTGMGPVNAERELRRALESRTPEAVFSCGFAGGLNPELPRGAVVYEADDDGAIAGALRRAGARPARFHASSRIVVRSSEKRALRETTGADAVEMESSIVRQVCREARLPSVTVRVISDTAQEDLPLDFNRCLTADARLDYVRLVAHVLASPRRVLGVLALQRHSRQAARALAEVLGRVMGGD